MFIISSLNIFQSSFTVIFICVMAIAGLIYLYVIFVVLTSTRSSDEISSADINRKLLKTAERSPQISAVLLECPRGERGRASEPNCERQMMVHIRMSSTFQTDSIDKFLLLDEVYDERRHTKAKLMAPYVIEVSRGEPVIMYPLEFTKSIRCDTCGHGNDNNTTSNSGKLCAKNSHVSPSDENWRSQAATVSDDTKLNAPIQSSSKEYHPARSTKAEVKTDEQQKERSNAQEHEQREKKEQDTGDHRDEGRFIDNEDSEKGTGAGAGAAAGEPPDEGESNDRLTIGIVAVDDGNLVKFQSRSEAEEGHMPSSEMEDSGSLYDTDAEYEVDDYDERDVQFDQGKYLRSRLAAPSPSQWSLKLDMARKRLSQEPERINACRQRKQSQPIAALIRSPVLDKNPRAHERIRQGSKELERYLKAVSDPKRSRLPEDKGGTEGMPRNQDKWVNDQYPTDGMQIDRGRIRSNVGNLNRETAYTMPGAGRLFRLHQQPDESSSDELLLGRQHPYTAIDDVGEEITAVDYRHDASARDLAPESESASNIAGIDNAAVGDELHLNAPNYRKGNEILTNRGLIRDVFGNSKLGGYGGRSENGRSPQRGGSGHELDRRGATKVKTKSVKDSGQRSQEGSTGSKERTKLPERSVEGLKPNDRSSSSSRASEDSSCSGKSRFSVIDKMIPRSSNAPGDVAVETAVVPNFPLNGYPEYLGLRRASVAPKPDTLSSKYEFLEKGPKEQAQQQTNEREDPNLTSKSDRPSRRMSTTKDSKPKSLNKRSYLVYDDLTMRDTNADYDDARAGIPGDVPPADRKVPPAHVGGSMDTSCNGRDCNSKSHDGPFCRCDRKDGQCKCSEKESTKKIRSVSEAWYSVFNMSAPLQFLTTRVRIYRKRHGTWLRIAPSVTLTSLSGIYANGNLSILFSSHVDIFQLKRPLTLRHHKLVVPRDGEEENAFSELSMDPREILAVDSTKFDLNAIHDGNKDTTGVSRAQDRLCRTATEAKQKHRLHRSHSIAEGVISIGDLGYFPTQMNLMQKCPTGDKRLCLNLLDEEVPAFSIKIKQPFLENTLVLADVYHVRIISVVSDATTRGALQVAVVLVNEYFVAHEFAVCICDCPMTCGAKTTVKKDLPPHSAERLSFLLPLEETKAKKYQCAARCLCSWDCSCHCVPDLVSHEDYNVCRKLNKNDEDWAGFIEGTGTNSRSLAGWGLFWRQMTQYTFALVFIMLLLGFLKASLGAMGLHRINRMGYDYVQPLLKYEYASRWRRFFINTLFFVVLPFIFCCKCFMPSEEDLLVASTEWQYSLLQQDVSDESSDDGAAAGGTDGTQNGRRGDGGGWKPHGRYRYNNDDNGTGGGGGTRASRRGEGRAEAKHRRVRYGNNINDDDNDDEEETILSQHFESGEGSQIAEMGIGHTRLNEYLVGACEDDDDEEERDTNYVLQALTESRESIRKLLNTQCNESIDPKDPRARQAEEYVRKLVAAKIVYRIFDKPLQNVDVPVGQRYSIRGYFVPSVGPGYQYFTPSPLAQLRRITANTTAILLPPVMLHAEAFSREYNSKVEVLQASDLSVNPPGDAPCINSSNVADPSQLTRARTLDISSSQVTKPLGGDATNATMR